MFGITAGLFAGVCSLAGIIMLKNKMAKTLLIGLWVGYFIYGFLFSYTTATHDYYQVLLAPIAAVSIAPVCQYVIRNISNMSLKWKWSLASLMMISLFLPLNYLRNIRHDSFLEIDPNIKHKLKYACYMVGANPQKLTKINHDYSNEIKMLRDIGSIVKHSDKTIILDENEGYPVEYFGEILGRRWPDKGQQSYAKNIAKREGISAQTQFSKIVRKGSPEYFIITDLESFNLQPELRDFLNANFKIFHITDDFIIYDLSNTKEDIEA
jgi:hypothetical protein